MDVFNIKIGFGDNELTLTVLPNEDGQYKIIYYGGVLGAIRLEADNETWEKVPDNELEAGDLPFYKHDLTADRLEIVLDDPTIGKIGEEIHAHS